MDENFFHGHHIHVVSVSAEAAELVCVRVCVRVCVAVFIAEKQISLISVCQDRLVIRMQKHRCLLQR